MFAPQFISRHRTDHCPFIPASFPGYIPVTYRLHTGHIQVTHRSYKDHIEVAYRSDTGYIQVSIAYT